MSVEESNDNIPVKDTHVERVIRGNNPKITRDETEDRFLEVQQENIVLKKHMRKQEDKIKQLATKLVRLVGERNNRDKRNDILVEDQKCRISELEAQVNGLKDKVLVTKQQLNSCTKLVPGTHKHVKLKPGPVQRQGSSLTLSYLHSDGMSEHVTHLLLEARAENQALKDRLQVLHEHMSTKESKISDLKEQLALKEAERQEEMMALRNQIEMDGESKKKKLAENVQLIRLQRDSKRTASWLASYETQYRTLETNFNNANETLGQLEFQLAEAQEELRQEKDKSLGLMKQVEDFSSVAIQLKEVETRLLSLLEENKILKEGHEALVAKALENSEKTKRAELEECTYKNQVTQLENTIRAELQAKAELIATIEQEKAKSAPLELKITEMEARSEQLAETLRSTQLKLDEAMKKLSQDIRLPDSCESCAQLGTDLNEVQWHLVQSREELTKTKNLLKTQISINKEYKKEIEILSTKLEKAELFHNQKLQEFMAILEERADQLTHFEQNMESLNKPTLSSIPIPVAEPMPSMTNIVNLPSATTLIGASNSMAVIESMIPAPPLAIESASMESLPPNVSTLPVEVHTVQPPAPLPTEPTQLEIANPRPTNSPENSSKFPTLEIHVEKYIPIEEDPYGEDDLFVTWEVNEADRNYSPIVSNGIFNAKAKHDLKGHFPLEGIEVQLHRTVGDKHCRMIATAYIVLGSNLTVSMHSVDTDEILGHLTYSCIIDPSSKTPEVDLESPKPLGDDSDIQNNNISTKLESGPTPLPKPRSRSTVTQPIPEPQPQQDDPLISIPLAFRQEKKELPPTKSILRREGSFSSPKHVSVNSTVDQREISEENIPKPPEIRIISTGTGIEDPSPYVGTTHSDFEIEVLAKIPEQFSAASSISEKQRRKRRKKKTPKPKDRETENSEGTYSLESGTETSRNVSDIESMAEEEFSQTVMSIEISWVQFNEKCRMWNDPNVKKFFVEYNFLNYPPDELETNTSLHKPQPGHRAGFNFVKVFFIDTAEKRKLLREMLKDEKPVKFTIVSEPADDDTIDCEDIGFAYVSFNDILKKGVDLTEEQVPIYDAENQRVQVGVICVSVQAIQVLKTL